MESTAEDKPGSDLAFDVAVFVDSRHRRMPMADLFHMAPEVSYCAGFPLSDRRTKQFKWNWEI